MTVPNFLTLCRILLTPLLIWLLLDRKLNEALVVFFVAGLTDGLDGMVARVFHQKSQLGAYLDPLADKILLVSSFLLLGHLELVPDWLVVIAVSRDAIILLGLMTLMYHHIAFEIKPVFLSKLTTLLQLGSVLAAISSACAPLPPWGYTTLFTLTAVFTIASGVYYLLLGIELLDSRRNNHDGHHK